MKNSNIVAAAVVALGVAVAGYFIGNAFYKGKKLDRYVTVKGLAEKEVNANLAIWPITINEASNDLGSLNLALKNKTKLVRQYLENAGFNEQEMSFNPPSILDVQAQRYYGNQNNPYRYLGDVKITVRTSNVDALKEAFASAAELIEKGVVISQDDYQNRIQYLYTALNDIKPAMIEEATKNAREAAEKFAFDSGAKVGNIRNATQGLFSITDRDMNSPDIKNIRVVTTIEYYLVDE